jgi:lipid A 3-O-deacylase
MASHQVAGGPRSLAGKLCQVRTLSQAHLFHAVFYLSLAFLLRSKERTDKTMGAHRDTLLFFFLLTVCCIFSLMPQVRADDAGRFTILEENDSLFFNSDKNYTQGLRLSDLSPTLEPERGWNDVFGFVGGNTPFLQSGQDRRVALFLGQSIFTPKNLSLRPPDSHDRPYAGCLYIGASLLQETDRRMLENLELDAGIVGPGSLAKEVQNDWHQFIGKAPAKGWSNQLQNEPGVMLSYERLWRLPLAVDPNNGTTSSRNWG